LAWTSGAFKKVRGKWPVEGTSPSQYHALCMIGGTDNCKKVINCSGKATTSLMTHLQQTHGPIHRALTKLKNVSL